MSARHKLLLFGVALSAAVGLQPLRRRRAVLRERWRRPARSDGWYTEGEAAVGGQVFIKKPGDTPSNSAAKFNEYGDNTEPLFLKSLNSSLMRKEGKTFASTCTGGNIGDDNEKLEGRRRAARGRSASRSAGTRRRNCARTRP